MSRFYFVGFLPPRSKARKAELEQLRDIPATLIFYEAPHRLLATLADMSAILGSRPACLARELTKMHEEWTRGTLTELLEIMSARAKIRGEITLVVGPGQAGIPETLRQRLAETGRRGRNPQDRPFTQGGFERSGAPSRGLPEGSLPATDRREVILIRASWRQVGSQELERRSGHGIRPRVRFSDPEDGSLLKLIGVKLQADW